jgi:hypothetical protein
MSVSAKLDRLPFRFLRSRTCGDYGEWSFRQQKLRLLQAKISLNQPGADTASLKECAPRYAAESGPRF